MILSRDGSARGTIGLRGTRSRRAGYADDRFSLYERRASRDRIGDLPITAAGPDRHCSGRLGSPSEMRWRPVAALLLYALRSHRSVAPPTEKRQRRELGPVQALRRRAELPL